MSDKANLIVVEKKLCLTITMKTIFIQQCFIACKRSYPITKHLPFKDGKEKETIRWNKRTLELKEKRTRENEVP